MNRILYFILLFGKFSYGQTMLDVATGEYSTQYVKFDGTVWVTYNTVYDEIWKTTRVSNLSNIVAADGGEYTSVFLDSAGNVYSSPGQSTISTAYTTDNTGAVFTGVSKVYAMWGMVVAIKSGEVWYWSFTNAGVLAQEDMLLQFSSTMSNGIPKPRKLIQPRGKTIVKCVFGSGISPYSSAKLWGLASDGTLWQWDQTHTTPFRVKGKPGFATTWTGTVVNAAMGPDITMVITSTNEVWCWGFNAANYGGHFDWENLSMTKISPKMQLAGIKFPLKQIVANYLCVQIVDADNNRWGIGNNQTGSLGNGYMSPSWRTNWDGASNAIYSYDYMPIHGNQNKWIKLPGKWKSIKTNPSFVFYSYGQDMAGNWYSWGRGKAQSLGNGVTYKVTDQATYPDWLDIPTPRIVMPLTQKWKVLDKVNINIPRLPIASAGINQYLNSGTTSVILDGTGSHQQQPGKIPTIKISNRWTQISGPNEPTISSPGSLITLVKELESGTYIFRNTVTNSLGSSDHQEVTVMIGPTEKIITSGK
jgi:alpha-tubulin suppressor-like RCC1 family protein